MKKLIEKYGKARVVVVSAGAACAGAAAIAAYLGFPGAGEKIESVGRALGLF